MVPRCQHTRQERSVPGAGGSGPRVSLAPSGRRHGPERSGAVPGTAGAPHPPSGRARAAELRPRAPKRGQRDRPAQGLGQRGPRRSCFAHAEADAGYKQHVGVLSAGTRIPQPSPSHRTWDCTSAKYLWEPCEHSTNPPIPKSLSAKSPGTQGIVLSQKLLPHFPPHFSPSFHSKLSLST